MQTTDRWSALGAVTLLLVACDPNASPSARAAPSAAPSPETQVIASALAPASAVASALVPVPGASAPAPSASVATADRTRGEALGGRAAPRADAGAAEAPGADGHGLTLIEAGAAPRRKLRYRFVVGRKDRLEMTTTSSMRMSLGARSAQVPTAPAVRVVAALTVKEVAADGSARRDLLIEEVGLLPGLGLSQEQRDQAEKTLGALEQLTGTDRVDARGFVREVRLDASKVESPALRQALASMQQTFDQMGAPFPEEDIGVGARWRLETRVEQMGIRLSQVATYELARLEGDHGTIRLQLVQTAAGGGLELPGLPAGATAKLRRMKGSGKGELAFELDRTLPAGRIDTRSEVEVSVSTGADEQKMNTRMEARVVFTPLPRQ